jgi:ribosomal protein L11 methyltransferase
MNYLEVTVYTTTQAADAVGEVLMEAGAGGVAIEDAADLALHRAEKGDWDYIDPDIFSGLGGEVRVICYLPQDEELRGRLDQIKYRMEDLLKLSDKDWNVGSGRTATRAVRQEDWENAWKKHYCSMKIGRNLVVVPTWEHYRPSGGEIVINLDPGMAFGTGTHETTVMCVQMLEKAVRTGDTMLDVGCGTGILSLCAARLGAEKVTAIDKDPVAVRVCRDHVKLNGLTDRIRVVMGDLLDKPYPKADILTVNIVADAVAKVVRQAQGVAHRHTQLIGSGIIREREQDVLDALGASGFGVAERMEMGEWVALRAQPV